MAMAARILEDRPPLDEAPLRAMIRRAHRADEAACVEAVLAEATLEPEPRARIQVRARRLAEQVRQAGGDQLGVEAFLHEYSLSTREGIMLMCLAEALLRIPDPETSDRLIRDKLSFGDWARHLGHSKSLFVNASTWGLMLTGRLVRVDLEREGEAGTRFARLVQRLGEPVARQAILQAMRVLGRHFVLGQTIEAAIRRARELEQKGYRYSYDMLGEGAKTTADALRYQPRLSGRDRSHHRGRRGRRSDGAPERLDQALGVASALRAGPAPPLRGRAAAAPPRAPDRRPRRPDHSHDRRRGGRPSGAIARSVRAPGVGARARRLAALGTTGILLGWTPFFKNKVRKEAMNNLAKFIRGDLR